MSISGLFIAVILEVSGDSTGHLSTLLHSCQLSIDSVKVKLSGESKYVQQISNYSVGSSTVCIIKGHFSNFDF